jgi:hypothetical protein
MYKLSLLVFILISHSIAFSQKEFKEWAPLGANWLYWKPTFSGEHFCVRIAHDRDTVINKRTYKVFDVYDLFVKPNIEYRSESKLGSYYIGIKGDSVFEYCHGENKEMRYVNKDQIGEKVYPFRSCDPNDTVWVQLDTIYHKKMSNFDTSITVKYRVYSSNASYQALQKADKDTIPEFMPYKLATSFYGATVHGSNFTFHKYLMHNSPCRCAYPIKNSPVKTPEKFECYYDPSYGSFNFFGGQCWLRNAYMTSDMVNALKPSFRVYPNPASNFIYLEVEKPLEYIYIIYDKQGKYLLSHKFHQTEKIDISNLPQGIYYISVQNQSVVLGSQKFIKD